MCPVTEPRPSFSHLFARKAGGTASLRLGPVSMPGGRDSSLERIMFHDHVLVTCHACMCGWSWRGRVEMSRRTERLPTLKRRDPCLDYRAEYQYTVPWLHGWRRRATVVYSSTACCLSAEGQGCTPLTGYSNTCRCGDMGRAGHGHRRPSWDDRSDPLRRPCPGEKTRATTAAPRFIIVVADSICASRGRGGRGRGRGAGGSAGKGRSSE